MLKRIHFNGLSLSRFTKEERLLVNIPIHYSPINSHNFAMTIHSWSLGCLWSVSNNFGRLVFLINFVDRCLSIRRMNFKSIIDPSPILCCHIFHQTNKPFTIFTAYSILNRIFDKFPFLLCFHHHKGFVVVFTDTICLWPRHTTWLVIKAITRTKPLSIYWETEKNKKHCKDVVFKLYQ